MVLSRFVCISFAGLVLAGLTVVVAGSPQQPKQTAAEKVRSAKVTVSELPAALGRICDEEKASYHRLLWRAYHLVQNSVPSRPWSEVQSTLASSGMKILSERRHEPDSWYKYLIRKGAFSAGPITHDLFLQINCRLEVTEDHPTFEQVYVTNVTLEAEINRFHKDLLKLQPYQKDTVLAKVLAHPDVEETVTTYPVLKSLSLEYSGWGTRWEAGITHGFVIEPKFVDRIDNSKSFFSPFFLASSGLDPSGDVPPGQGIEAGQSKDTVNGLFQKGSHAGGSGWGNGHYLLRRLGQEEADDGRPDWVEVYNAPDVRLIPKETRSVRVKPSKFASQALKELSLRSGIEALEYEEQLREEDAPVISKMTGLKSLEIRSEKSSDVVVEQLIALPHLQEFVIRGTSGLTDEGCRSVGRMKELKVLQLGWTKLITDTGIKHLSKLEKLEKLYGYLPIEDHTLDLVANLSKLRSLSITDSDKITPANLSYLRRLKNLKSLSISKSSMDDEGMRIIATIPSLERLYLSDLSITDAGLQFLGSLPHLKYLYIYGCEKVTDDGMARLQIQLPGRYERK